MDIEIRFNGVLRGGTLTDDIVTIHTPHPIYINITDAISYPDFKILSDLTSKTFRR